MKNTLIIVLAVLVTSCAPSIKIINQQLTSDKSLRLSLDNKTIPTSTCTLISLSSTNGEGQSYPLSESLTIHFSGLGTVLLYPTQEDCQKNTNTTESATLVAGQSKISLYLKCDTEGSYTITSEATGYNSAYLIASIKTFELLGQSSTTDNRGLRLGLSQPSSVTITGNKMFVVDKDNHRVLGWNTVPITNSQNPDFVLGQDSLFANQSNRGGSPASNTLSSPTNVSADVNHLVVSDTGNHRVLIWNSLPTTSGTAADIVIGQENFVTNDTNHAGLSDSTLSSPEGVFTDGNFLAVADSGNHRVLIWYIIPTSSFTSANTVLGQSTFTSHTANAGGLSASSLNHPSRLFYDGTYFWVTDTDNNRVLQWNHLPSVNQEPANLVLGQNLFTTQTSGADQNSFSGPQEVYSDGTHVLVSDTLNNRVLVWNTIPVTNNQVADVVIGQNDFTTVTANTDGISANTLSYPTGIAKYGNKLFIADSDNNRLLQWTTLPSQNGLSAYRVIGQPDFVSSVAGFSADSISQWNQPSHVFSDGKHLFVTDQSNHRVIVWKNMPTTNNEEASFVIGQPNSSASTANNSGISGSTLNRPTSTYSDGTRLFIADSGNNRVLGWNTIPTTALASADFVLGQSDFTQSDNSVVSAKTLSNPTAVWVKNSRLYIVDSGNNRVLVWNTIPTTTAASADIVLGQPDMTTNTSGASATSLNAPTQVLVDSSHVMVSDTGNHRVLLWNSVPQLSNQAADVVLGQTQFTSQAANSGGLSANSLNTPNGVYYDGNVFLIADQGNHRVLGWRTYPNQNGQAPDFVIGQRDFSLALVNTDGLSAHSLYSPSYVYSDGTRLFIADTNNNRVLITPMP